MVVRLKLARSMRATPTFKGCPCVLRSFTAPTSVTLSAESEFMAFKVARILARELLSHSTTKTFNFCRAVRANAASRPERAPTNTRQASACWGRRNDPKKPCCNRHKSCSTRCAGVSGGNWRHRLASSLRPHIRSPLGVTQARSEEHTSELQSPDHLVCRLLLEKKKK